MNRRPVLHALLAGLAIGGPVGCVHYQPRPISPSETLAAFEARTLDDPGLTRFIEENGAAPSAPGVPWDLKRLVLAAFHFSPDLDLARAELSAARAASVTAGARENPSASISAGFNSTTPVSTISPWILGFNLDVPLTTAGKRGHRIARAHSLAEAARFNVAAVAWQVRSHVRASLVELYASTNAETLVTQQQAVLHDSVSLLERQLEAGAVGPFEVTQAHLALASGEIALREASARTIAARARLADAVGIPATALVGVTLSFEDPLSPADEIPAAKARREAVLNRADVLGALAEYDASQAALQLEIARQYPDIHLGPGYEFDQGDDKWLLAVSIPLPIVNGNRGPIAEAEAARAAAATRFAAVQAHAIAQVDQATAAYEAARDAEATAGRMASDLERQERAAQARFEAGEISRLELGGARLERVAAALARLDATVKAQSALGQLEDAMQSTIGSPAGAWQRSPGLLEPEKEKEHP